MSSAITLFRRFLLVGFACLSIFPLTARDEADTPEAAVYAALFEHLSHKGENVRTVMLRSQADGQGEVLVAADSTVSLEDLLRKVVPEAGPALSAFFVSEMKRGGPLKTHQLPRKPPLKFQLVSERELDDVFQSISISEAWTRFFQRFPHAIALMSLSRPAIDSVSQTALMYVGSSCGPLCGGGWLLYMTRHDGAWRVVREVQLWIA